jgi:hypothetical protein
MFFKIEDDLQESRRNNGVNQSELQIWILQNLSFP